MRQFICIQQQSKQYFHQMQGDSNHPTTRCHSCGRDILTSNFLIHEGRCQRLYELRSSRVLGNEQKQQNSFHSVNENEKSQQGKNEQPRRAPYSFSKMNMREDIKQMSKPQFRRQPEQKIACPFCGYMQTLAQLDTHPNQCEHREVGCNYCGGKFPRSLMDDHEEICQKNPRNVQRSNRVRMRRDQPQYESEEEDDMPMIFNQRSRNMYEPSSLMDMFNHALFTGRQPARQEEYGRGPNYQVFQFSSNSNNGQPRVIYRTNSTNPSTFIQLIEMLARRANPNQNPGMSQQELSSLPKVSYHKKNEQADLCTICYCEFEENEGIIELSCKHMFHQECIFEWLKRVSNCPVCKKKLKEGRGEEEEEEEFEDFEERPDNWQHQHQHNHSQNNNGQQQGGFFNFFQF